MTPVPQISRVDVRGTELAERCTNGLLVYRRLEVGDTMEVVDRGDPIDLYNALHALAPGDFSWLYVERGPEVWRVRVRKLGRVFGAGGCCGTCGGGNTAATNPSRSIA